MMRPTIVHVSAWGHAWIERARHEALACLRDNLPALEGTGPLRVIVSTDDATLVNELRRMDVEIVLIDDPRDASASRDLMGACEFSALRAAINEGADFFPLCADHVFPHCHIAIVKRLLDTKRAVVGTSIRCHRERFHAWAERLVWEIPVLTHDVFHAVMMESVHPDMQGYVVADPPNVAPANVHQLVYPKGDAGFDVVQGQAAMFGLRCADLDLAVAVSPRAECQLLADIIEDPDAEMCFVCDPRDGVALVGLDGDEGLTRFGSFPTTEEEFARTCGIFQRSPRDAALWAWSASHRVPYHRGGTW